MFFLGVAVAGWASILGGLNLLASVLRMRAKGITPFRMPIFVWAAIATSLISTTATQLIGLSFQMVMFQRLFGMGFFDSEKGGNPILFQHLFWFYSHPAVYVFVLPGLGIISELMPVFARKPLFGYRFVAMSSLGIALVGFLVWAHHMFVSGMNPYLRIPFMFSTLLVAVPTGVKFFSWVSTLWKGKIEAPTPMLFVIGGVVVFFWAVFLDLQMPPLRRIFICKIHIGSSGIFMTRCLAAASSHSSPRKGHGVAAMTKAAALARRDANAVRAAVPARRRDDRLRLMSPTSFSISVPNSASRRMTKGMRFFANGLQLTITDAGVGGARHASSDFQRDLYYEDQQTGKGRERRRSCRSGCPNSSAISSGTWAQNPPGPAQASAAAH